MGRSSQSTPARCGRPTCLSCRPPSSSACPCASTTTTATSRTREGPPASTATPRERWRRRRRPASSGAWRRLLSTESQPVNGHRAPGVMGVLVVAIALRTGYFDYEPGDQGRKPSTLARPLQTQRRLPLSPDLLRRGRTLHPRHRPTQPERHDAQNPKSRLWCGGISGRFAKAWQIEPRSGQHDATSKCTPSTRLAPAPSDRRRSSITPQVFHEATRDRHRPDHRGAGSQLPKM